MKKTINNIQIAYTDEGKGTPLLFVHGFPLSRGAWQKQIDALKSSYRTIAPDLRGHGESEAKAGVATMEDYARDLHALLQEIKTGPVVLIGHSMGGYIVFAFARLFPEMVSKLVLVGTRAAADSSEGAAARRTTAEKVKTDGVQFVIETMTSKMLSPKNQDRKILEEVRGLMASTKPEGLIAATLGMAQRPDSTSALSKISVPTLVITGADDALIPAAESVKMAQAIPGAQLEIVPQAGHLVAYEKPEEFNLILKDWLAGKLVSKPTPQPVQVFNITPIFLVEDIKKSAEYYRDVLGFSFNQYYGEPPCFVMLALGPAEIFLSVPESSNGEKLRMRPNGKTACIWDAYIRVSQIEPLCELYRKRGAKIVREPETTFYQMREFEVEDINGYRLCFGHDTTA